MGRGVPEYDSPLFVDMYICSKFLHCSHEEYQKMPRLERKKWKEYIRVRNEKHKHEMDELDRKTNKT